MLGGFKEISMVKKLLKCYLANVQELLSSALALNQDIMLPLIWIETAK
jgi:hypothetical protein